MNKLGLNIVYEHLLGSLIGKFVGKWIGYKGYFVIGAVAALYLTRQPLGGLVGGAAGLGLWYYVEMLTPQEQEWVQTVLTIIEYL